MSGFYEGIWRIRMGGYSGYDKGLWRLSLGSFDKGIIRKRRVGGGPDKGIGRIRVGGSEEKEAER